MTNPDEMTCERDGVCSVCGETIAFHLEAEAGIRDNVYRREAMEFQKKLGRALQLLIELREWCGSEYHSNAKIDAKVDEFLKEMKEGTP